MCKGRLSEILGAEAIPVDRFMRTIGLIHRSEHTLNLLPIEEIDTLTSYSNGVNEAVRQMTHLPTEF
jgi:penicillin G amidase